MFPRVVVVERQLSGEPPTWYVYRDGRWAPPSATSWWTDPDMPCISVGLDGWIVEANPAGRALLNMPASDIGRRHFTDFIVPGTLEDAEALHQVISQGHDLAATVLLRPTDGEVLACDVRAQRVGDRVICVFRLAEDIVVRGEPLATTVELGSHPESDVAFRRHAELLLSRMPEPTPEGLALRLRRLYVHARVEPLDGRWMAFRDGRDLVEAPDGWWLAPDLPRVRCDEQSLIFEANEAAEILFGRPLIGRHWHDFVAPGASADVDAMVAIVMRAGTARTRFRLPSAGGSSIEFDSFTEFDGVTLTSIMRPVGPTG